ncbi:YktB family protein [Macrococcus animalis]|uniref:YktB family protein n=1 Tax=Macrococcus animalis TaxID=3395467 RepID=UPI0039BDB553
MIKYTFTNKDFDVFKVEGLASRMEVLIETTRPKLENLGDHFSKYLSEQTDETFYPHVAKHLRRKTNPPNDTWVAFSTNKRGYKMLPHFQIGLFGSHAFVLFGIIYESPDKERMASKWKKQIKTIQSLDNDYIIKGDHMKEDYDFIKNIQKKDIDAYINRLVDVKKGELMFGKVFYPGDDALKSDKSFIQAIEKTYFDLLPLYQ